MKHTVEVAVKFTFIIDDQDNPELLPHLINGNLREVVEQAAPEGWGVAVGSPIVVDGKMQDHVYE